MPDIEVHAENVLRLLDSIGDKFAPAIGTALEIMGKKYVSFFKTKNLRYKFKFGKKTNFMMRRSQEFARSLLMILNRAPMAKDVWMKVGWFDRRNAMIAALNEYGTRGAGGVLPNIRAKSSNYLAIPLPAAMTASGEKIHESPWDWPDTFIYRSKKSGKLIIARKSGRTSIPLYVLQKEVSIPRRLKFAETYKMWFQSTGFDIMAKKFWSEVKAGA